MDLIRLRVLLQHILNQSIGRWRLPSNDFECRLPNEPNVSQWIPIAEAYLEHQRASVKADHFPPDSRWRFINAVIDVTNGMANNKFSCLYCVDDSYPHLLKHTKRFPLVLFVRGSKCWTTKPLVAIVGARKATDEALSASYNLAIKLARNGYCVISGGAFGCDAAAHKGAIDSGVPHGTAAVFASGVLNLYPRRLSDLYEQILSTGGAILSERLPSVSPARFDFPIRNRIIAGMCEELHLMQAGEASGAMITANIALDLGRDVRVWNPFLEDIRFIGNAKLLGDGAQNSQFTEKTLRW